MLLIGLTACASIKINPLYPQDYFPVKEGETCGNVTAQHDGYYFSKKAVGNIMKARVGE